MIDEKLLSFGARRYGMHSSDLKLVGGFSENVFECDNGRDNFILKFYLSSTYEKSAIELELDWILYLHQSGMNVTAPIASSHGNLLEVVEMSNKEQCWIIAFEKAKGKFVNVSDKREWNTNTFYIWGKTLGKIHSLSKQYEPKTYKRSWNSESLFLEENDVSEEIKCKWNKYINELEKLPKDENSYGMIHHDLHHKNFYLYGQDIILFDFGDCVYHWFVYDIAIVLYHALQTVSDDNVREREDFAIVFLRSFLNGYTRENQLDPQWLLKIPFFLTFRQIYSYMYFSKYLSEEQRNNDKTREILNNMKAKIENDIPFIDLQIDRIVEDYSC